MLVIILLSFLFLTWRYAGHLFNRFILYSAGHSCSNLACWSSYLHLLCWTYFFSVFIFKEFWSAFLQVTVCHCKSVFFSFWIFWFCTLWSSWGTICCMPLPVAAGPHKVTGGWGILDSKIRAEIPVICIFGSFACDLPPTQWTDIVAISTYRKLALVSIQKKLYYFSSYIFCYCSLLFFFSSTLLSFCFDLFHFHFSPFFFFPCILDLSLFSYFHFPLLFSIFCLLLQFFAFTHGFVNKIVKIK